LAGCDGKHNDSQKIESDVGAAHGAIIHPCEKIVFTCAHIPNDVLGSDSHPPGLYAVNAVVIDVQINFKTQFVGRAMER